MTYTMTRSVFNNYQHASLPNIEHNVEDVENRVGNACFKYS